MTNTPFLFSSVQRQTDAEISLRSVEAHAKEQEAELSRRVAELSAQLRQSREEARQAPKNDKKPRTPPISPMCRTPFSPYLTVIFFFLFFFFKAQERIGGTVRLRAALEAR